MKNLPILVATISLSISAFSMANSEEAKQAAEACLIEAEKRYDTAKAISKPTKYRGSGNRGYKINFQVGEKNKKVKCIRHNSGKIMIVKK